MINKEFFIYRLKSIREFISTDFFKVMISIKKISNKSITIIKSIISFVQQNNVDGNRNDQRVVKMND